jgi:hypothetical protein
MLFENYLQQFSINKEYIPKLEQLLKDNIDEAFKDQLNEVSNLNSNLKAI